jgi:UDP-N-acetyl-D-mannosaminuronic acid dehydrogenase
VNGNIFLTDCSTAEMAKLVENAYRDVNIAFANELSLICDSLGIRVWEVIELANKHPRVNILQPGPGVGGHCIAVDPWFIVDSAPDQSRLIRMAREVNDSKPHFVVEKVKKQAQKFKAPLIGCLGLAYKNDVDDLRQSPALDITRQLIQERVGKVMVCEPYVKSFEEFDLHPLNKVLVESDILVLLVNHRQFYDVDRELLQEKIVIDTRGIWR